MELKKIIQRTPPPGPLPELREGEQCESPLIKARTFAYLTPGPGPELREGEQCESHLIKAKTFAYLTPRPPLQYLERGRKTHLEVPSLCNGEGI